MRRLVFLFVFGCIVADLRAAAPPGFVKTNGLSFSRYGKKYVFLGANLWYGMNLGARDRAQLVVFAYESGLVRPG